MYIVIMSNDNQNVNFYTFSLFSCSFTKLHNDLMDYKITIYLYQQPTFIIYKIKILEIPEMSPSVKYSSTLLDHTQGL